MNFQLLALLISISILILCDGTLQFKPISTKNDARIKSGIMKAFLMQCPANTTGQTHIQVTVQIGVSTSKPIGSPFVGKIVLEDLNELNQKIACDLKGPSMIDVSNEEYVLMYTLKFENKKPAHENPTNAESFEKTSRLIKPHKHFEGHNDVHTADNARLLHDDIHYNRIKPSDFVKTSNFMHTIPKDFRRDSICTKSHRKDNSKNNANNEYANEEFYGDRNQRENENAFSGKLEMSLNNDEIDKIKSNKNRNDNGNIVVNGIGYFTKNFLDDSDLSQRRKKMKKYKSDFIKCFGRNNLKKIDDMLCTCARDVNEMNVDETESNDEQSDCFQLINNVCPWGPVYNKNINYGMKTNDDIRNVNYDNIKSTAFACCDLLPTFYFTLGTRCNNFIKDDDAGILISNEPAEIIKHESDAIIDKTMSLIRSNFENGGSKSKNTIHSETISSEYSPKRAHNDRNKSKIIINGRLINIKAAPLYENAEASDGLFELRNLNKKHTLPLDNVIYDPHLSIADKMQLVDTISPKRPCERNQKNKKFTYEERRKRSLKSYSPLTDEELDYALENYENSDSTIQDELKNSDYSEITDPKPYAINKNASINQNGSLRKLQSICSLHPCLLALPFEKDPYFGGEMKFLGNNGFRLNIAENICHNHFHEYILIPFEYANEGGT